jgi:hypothetical protein
MAVGDKDFDQILKAALCRTVLDWRKISKNILENAYYYILCFESFLRKCFSPPDTTDDSI